MRILLFAVAVAVLVAACAAPSDLETTDGLLAVVSEGTATAGTARISIGVVDLYTLDGVLDLVTGDQELRGEIPFGALAAAVSDDGQAVVLGEPDAVQVHVVVLDGVLYLGGDPRLDGAYATQAFGSAEASSAAGLLADPRALLASLVSDGFDPVEIGPGEVRGDTTTRYRIDQPMMEGAAETLGEESSIAQLRVATTIHVDDQNRLRRIETSGPYLPDADADSNVASEPETRSTMDLYDFGVAVDIVAPSPTVPLESSALFPDGGAEDQ